MVVVFSISILVNSSWVTRIINSGPMGIRLQQGLASFSHLNPDYVSMS